MLSRTPVNGNRLIASHLGTMQSVLPAIRGNVGEGDCVVVRPAGGSRFEHVGIVPWRAWLQAAQIDTALPRF